MAAARPGPPLAFPRFSSYEAGMRRLLCVLVLIAAPSLADISAKAAELLLYTRKSCAYCQLWERQIGPIYPKTAEAALAPLRRIDLDRADGGGPALDPPVAITPTFVLMDGPREIGRFSGYTNDLTFWSMLGVLLQRMEGGDGLPAAKPAEYRQ